MIKVPENSVLSIKNVVYAEMLRNLINSPYLAYSFVCPSQKKLGPSSLLAIASAISLNRTAVARVIAATMLRSMAAAIAKKDPDEKYRPIKWLEGYTTLNIHEIWLRLFRGRKFTLH